MVRVGFGVKERRFCSRQGFLKNVVRVSKFGERVPNKRELRVTKFRATDPECSQK